MCTQLPSQRGLHKTPKDEPGHLSGPASGPEGLGPGLTVPGTQYGRFELKSEVLPKGECEVRQY
jgi:hypothetical protein